MKLNFFIVLWNSSMQEWFRMAENLRFNSL